VRKFLATIWLFVLAAALLSLIAMAIYTSPEVSIVLTSICVVFALTAWSLNVLFPQPDNRYPPPGFRRGPLPPPPPPSDQ
jgi:hypothetical protein